MKLTDEQKKQLRKEVDRMNKSVTKNAKKLWERVKEASGSDKK